MNYIDSDIRFGDFKDQDSILLSKTCAYNLRKVEVSEEEKSLSSAATFFIRKNKGRERYAALRDCSLKCSTNKLAMYYPPSSGLGYGTERDTKVWDIRTETRDILMKEVGSKDEEQIPIINTLLVNYAKRLPFVVEIGKDPAFIISEKYYDKSSMQTYSNLLDYFFALSFDSCLKNPLLVGLKNKKDTALGFPDETVDGDPVHVADISWGIEDEILKSNILARKRLLQNRSHIKGEWRDKPYGCSKIFQDQCNFIDSGSIVNPSNIGACIENNIITVCKVSLRENAPDAPLIGDVSWKPFDPIFSKDRNFSIYNDSGLLKYSQKGGLDTRYQISGSWNSKLLNSAIQEMTKMPGAVNRIRKIYPSNNMMHTYGTTLARAHTRDVEESCKGHPSTRDCVVQDWNNFYTIMTSRGYTVIPYSGDCKNAEVTQSSNSLIMNCLIPERYRKYKSLTSVTVLPNGDRYRVGTDMYCSAVWYTTWQHIIKGNFEYIRILYYILTLSSFKLYNMEKVTYNITTIAFGQAMGQDYIKTLLQDDFDVETNSVCIGDDVWVNPKLATDDMAGQIATKMPSKIVKECEYSKMLKDTMMSFSFGRFVAFGMLCDNTLQENKSSRLAKLYTSERMGFAIKDAFSTYIRIHESGCADMIDYVLRKHTGYTHLDYAPAINAFYEWLQSHGVNFKDVFNEYSFSSMLLYGKYVSDYAEQKGKKIPIFLKSLNTDDSSKTFKNFDHQAVDYMYAIGADQLDPKDIMEVSASVKEETVTRFLNDIDIYFHISGVLDHFPKI